MLRHLRREQRDGIAAAGLAEVAQAQARALARMHWCATLQIGQGEGGLSIAAIGGAKQREQRGVLRDRQNLSVTGCPPGRREVEAKDADLGNKWVRHSA